jgi:hypothetical protein
MTREEFEQRKRRLEEQLQEGIELLKAGFRQQLRALEMVWMATTEVEDAPPRSPAEARPEELAAPVRTSAAPPSRPRQKSGQLWADIDAALDQVPEVFDRNDLIKALGYEPDRSALHRVMRGLLRSGAIVLKSRNAGKIPAKYELVYAEEEDGEPADDEPGEETPPAS